MTSSVERAGELAGKIAAEGVRAVIDPRDANPPCVLVVAVPARTRATWCAFQYTWRIWCLAPGAGNLDAAVKLDELFAAVDAALTVDNGTPQTYPLANQDIAGYLIEYVEVV